MTRFLIAAAFAAIAMMSVAKPADAGISPLIRGTAYVYKCWIKKACRETVKGTVRQSKWRSEQLDKAETLEQFLEALEELYARAPKDDPLAKRLTRIMIVHAVHARAVADRQ